jgi:hypothetical protein
MLNEFSLQADPQNIAEKLCIDEKIDRVIMSAHEEGRLEH